MRALTPNLSTLTNKFFAREASLISPPVAALSLNQGRTRAHDYSRSDPAILVTDRQVSRHSIYITIYTHDLQNPIDFSLVHIKSAVFISLKKNRIKNKNKEKNKLTKELTLKLF